MASAKHRYELIVKDVTWKEAEVLCHESGGYLATITSHEEYERLQERMISEYKGDIPFSVGATNERVEGTTFGYHWLEPGIKYGYYMLDLSNLNDVPNDILEAAPSYAGRVGYICKYE